MTPEEALSLAIFAINTWMHPDASSDEDVHSLDSLVFTGQGEEAVAILVQLRDSAKGLERALPDLIPEAKCTYCGAPLHRTDSVSKWEDAKGSPFCPAEGQKWHSAEPLADTIPVVEQAKAVERGELPSGSVIVKITGERSLATPGPDSWTCPGCLREIEPSDVRRHASECDRYDGQHGY